MTMSGHGQLRATDADREKVHAMLQSAYADGRLTWEEFESRTAALIASKTYGELSPLTADLHVPAPYQPYPAFASDQGGTNPLAITSMVCGVLQFPFWLVTGIPAIICGHIARNQIRRTGQQGAGLAMTGLILGYAGLLLTILSVVALIAGVDFFLHLAHTVPPHPIPPNHP
ncbi:MAG TPA: DUF1707 and DUF4190 domain-containing protein [Streptosporangiaceae bacterium]